MRHNRPRLLVIGPWLPATGCGRATESVLARMTALDAVLFAVDHDGSTLHVPFRMQAGDVPADPGGARRLPGVLDQTRPDVVLIHDEGLRYQEHLDAIAAHGEARSVVSLPVEWPVIEPAVARTLARADGLITCSQFGQRALIRAFEAEGVTGPPVNVVPRGVDLARFHPLDGRDDDDDRFIVLNANRNIDRKRIDLTLRGFAEFAAGRSDAHLYLHMGMHGAGGSDVLALARELGIEDRLVTTTRGAEPPLVDDADLNAIYAACDVGLNTAEAEAWGLTAFEHAATGAPQVVPDGTACAELWDERRGALRVPGRATERGGVEVTPEGVAAALGRLYDDRSLLGELGARANAYATSPQFDWNPITQAWEDVLLEVLARSEHAPRSVR